MLKYLGANREHRLHNWDRKQFTGVLRILCAARVTNQTTKCTKIIHSSNTYDNILQLEALGS